MGKPLAKRVAGMRIRTEIDPCTTQAPVKLQDVLSWHGFFQAAQCGSVYFQDKSASDHGLQDFFDDRSMMFKVLSGEFFTALAHDQVKVADAIDISLLSQGQQIGKVP